MDKNLVEYLWTRSAQTIEGFKRVLLGLGLVKRSIEATAVG